MSEAPLVYLIYGIPDSGRREIIFDLIEGGIDPGEQVLYFRPNAETVSSYDEQIEALENVSVVGWDLFDCKVRHGKITAAPDKIIFMAPGTADPADVAEALKAWSEHNTCQTARIITIVHCSFLRASEKALPWFDACIHFSDMVLLNRREAGDNKWTKNFEERYHKDRYPCRFEPLKKGRTSNPAAVLEPEARRLSLYFDELIPIEEDEFEDEEQPEDIRPDRYIERNESGQRMQPVVNITRFLS
ncbi:MAG: GTP-binding protein [Verrucomicrobiota bacterium]